ncbi:MAG: hypothetical protein ACO222_07835 [Polynucleobacter sp.]
MTASYTWPVGLPQEPLFGSFSESIGYNYLSSQMDAGPAKIRRRSSKANQMSMTFMMSTSQLATLKTFVDSTISGVARFYFDHPVTGSTIEVRIVPSSDGALYSLSQANSGYWNVSMTMEQLP